jgi:hypothetical protein
VAEALLHTIYKPLCSSSSAVTSNSHINHQRRGMPAQTTAKTHLHSRPDHATMRVAL